MQMSEMTDEWGLQRNTMLVLHVLGWEKQATPGAFMGGRWLVNELQS